MTNCDKKLFVGYVRRPRISTLSTASAHYVAPVVCTIHIGSFPLGCTPTIPRSRVTQVSRPQDGTVHLVARRDPLNMSLLRHPGSSLIDRHQQPRSFSPFSSSSPALSFFSYAFTVTKKFLLCFTLLVNGTLSLYNHLNHLLSFMYDF